MTRREYPEPAEGFVKSIEEALPEGATYIGRGCACTGSPLVYRAGNNLKIEIWPLRRYYRVQRNRMTLHTDALHTASELTELLKIL